MAAACASAMLKPVAPHPGTMQPVPALAWIVTVSGDALGVEGEAIEWTPRAVRVSHVDKVGHQDTVRVWVSAVARRWAVASRTVWTGRYASRQRKAPGQP